MTHRTQRFPVNDLSLLEADRRKDDGNRGRAANRSNSALPDRNSPPGRSSHLLSSDRPQAGSRTNGRHCPAPAVCDHRTIAAADEALAVFYGIGWQDGMGASERAQERRTMIRAAETFERMRDGKSL